MLSARFEAALAELEAAVREAPSPELSAEIFCEKGVIEAALDRYGEALVSFARAATLARNVHLDADESGDVAAEIFECARLLVSTGVDADGVRRALAATEEPGSAAHGQPFRCPSRALLTPPLEPPPITSAGASAEPERATSTLALIGVGIGAAAVITGGVFGVVALSERRALDAGVREQADLASLEATERRGRDLALAADVLVISGLLVGAIAWLSD